MPAIHAVSACAVKGRLERLRKTWYCDSVQKVCISHSWLFRANSKMLFLLEFEHSCLSLSPSFQLGWYK